MGVPSSRVAVAVIALTTLIFGLFCLCQVTRVMLEERVLAARFPEYIAYRRRTPAVLPWPRQV